MRVGTKATIAVLEHAPRCKMITLDPNTGEQNAGIMKQLARAHETKPGIYGAVLIEGTIRPGDEISLMD